MSEREKGAPSMSRSGRSVFHLIREHVLCAHKTKMSKIMTSLLSQRPLPHTHHFLAVLKLTFTPSFTNMLSQYVVCSLISAIFPESLEA